jgi:putative ABC transport system substrate-binding protein
MALLGGAAVAWPSRAGAQQPAMPVIAVLGGIPLGATARLAGFRQGLKEAGFVEGQNVAIEYRWAEGEYGRLPTLATELVHRPVAVIVSVAGTPGALAAKAATTSIPIVFITGNDPVSLGLVASLNRPGRNVTGVTVMTLDLTAKRVEVLREIMPAAGVVTLLVNPTNSYTEAETKEAQQAARKLGLRLDVVNARSEGDIETAFGLMRQMGTGALLVSSDPSFGLWSNQIVGLAARHALPAIYPYRDFSESGGLVSYGASVVEGYRQVGIYTGRILKGEKPADLPIERPTKFELVVNLRTAKALGLEVPPTLLARADEVIE